MSAVPPKPKARTTTISEGNLALADRPAWGLYFLASLFVLAAVSILAVVLYLLVQEIVNVRDNQVNLNTIQQETIQHRSTQVAILGQQLDDVAEIDELQNGQMAFLYTRVAKLEDTNQVNMDIIDYQATSIAAYETVIAPDLALLQPTEFSGNGDGIVDFQLALCNSYVFSWKTEADVDSRPFLVDLSVPLGTPFPLVNAQAGDGSGEAIGFPANGYYVLNVYTNNAVQWEIRGECRD